MEGFKDLSEEFKALTPVWTRWFRISLVILAMQLSVSVYDFTLPSQQMLWLPFFGCYLLTQIPLCITGRKRGAICRKMTATVYEMQLANIAAEEEAYKLITGEDRRR